MASAENWSPLVEFLEKSLFGRREEGSGWGTHLYLWQIHFDIWQNQYNIVKLNKIKLNKKEKSLLTDFSVSFN